MVSQKRMDMLQQNLGSSNVGSIRDVLQVNYAQESLDIRLKCTTNKAPWQTAPQQQHDKQHHDKVLTTIATNTTKQTTAVLVDSPIEKELTS